MKSEQHRETHIASCMYLDFQQIVLSQCCSLCTMQCVAACTTVPGWQQVATKTEQDCCSILYCILGVRFIGLTAKAPMTTSTNRCPFIQELASGGHSIEAGTQHAASCSYQSFTITAGLPTKTLVC